MKKFLFSVKYFTSVILFAEMVIAFPATPPQVRAALPNQSQNYKNPYEKISPDLQSRLLSTGDDISVNHRQFREELKCL